MRQRAAALALVAMMPSAAAVAAECKPDRALLTGGPQPLQIAVEIADDAGERAQGLMHRKDLPRGQGMLFIYDTPQKVSFWMRNTLIPLDMIFIDERGGIRHIHPMARPHDESAIPGAAVGDPSPERLMVLEIAGGEAGRLGIRPGMVLAHPALPQDRAAVRCD